MTTPKQGHLHTRRRRKHVTLGYATTTSTTPASLTKSQFGCGFGITSFVVIVISLILSYILWLALSVTTTSTNPLLDDAQQVKQMEIQPRYSCRFIYTRDSSQVISALRFAFAYFSDSIRVCMQVSTT